MKHRHGDFLAGNWSEPNAARQSASHVDCDEAIIGSLASNILILDADDRNRLLYTVAGSAVERALGAKLRGTGFLDHWDARDQRMLQDYCQRALARHQPLRLLYFCGARVFAFETVLVPVAIPGTARKRFIGISIQRNDQPAATPLHRVQHLTHIGFVREDLIVADGNAREL